MQENPCSSEEILQLDTKPSTRFNELELEVSSSTADIGTGTYTIMTQTAADALGLSMDDVTAKLCDPTLPHAPVEGGSWMAASVGSAILEACKGVRKVLRRDA